MRVRWGGCRREGRAVDLRGTHVDARAFVAAVRDPADDRVACSAPGPAHEHVGFVHHDVDFDRRRALAAVARSRGLSAPQDAALADIAERFDALSVPSVDLEAARRRVAEAGAAEAELRERVARLGGQVEARRDLGADVDAAQAELADAARALAEAETERLAAEQALDSAREAAREARDARERRLELVDRRRNRRRAARQHLAGQVEDAFEEHLGRVPGPSGESGVAAALAAARVADLAAPVVIACDRFETPARARAFLDAPVALV